MRGVIVKDGFMDVIIQSLGKIYFSKPTKSKLVVYWVCETLDVWSVENVHY